MRSTDAVVELHLELQVGVARVKRGSAGISSARPNATGTSTRRRPWTDRRVPRSVSSAASSSARMRWQRVRYSAPSLVSPTRRVVRWKQLAAQVLLEIGDVGAHDGAREAERIRRAGEGVQVRHPHEAAHADQLVHACYCMVSTGTMSS